MCKSCNKKKPCKSCQRKANLIVAGLTGGLSVDQILSQADFVGIAGSTLGVAVGEIVYNKARAQNWGNTQFRLFIIGLGAVVIGIYGNAVAGSAFMRGFWTGFGASGSATILRGSGIAAFSGIWNGSFVNGLGSVVEKVRYHVGGVKPFAKLPARKTKNKTVPV